MKSEKPQFSHIKALVKQTEEREAFLKTAIDGQKGEIASVRQAADDFYSAKLIEALQSIDVDILTQGKQGIRVSSLRTAGICNIYDLSRYSIGSIESIDGIGAQNARKIYETTRQIVDNTKAKLSLRLNVDMPTKADDTLIAALYVLLCHDSVRPLCKELLEKYRKPIRNDLQSVKPATGGIKWFFASKRERDAALSAVSSLEERLTSDLFTEVDADWYCAVSQADITECRAHFRDNASAYYAALETHCKHLNTAEPSETGLSAELLAEIEAQPLDLQYLKATLRSYQTFGVKYAVNRKRTLLGDEMGLGKTIQAIGAMAAVKAEGGHHFMVVCPASVMINWTREIEKHSTLVATKVHGDDEDALRFWRENGDVAVTTYESISRFGLPEKFRFDMLVVDEAHYVKNPQAQRTVAMRKLLEKTDRVLYMSGTPLVNRVDEMCFLVNCLQPEIAARLEQVKNVTTAEQFRQELAPVYLRRVRENVLKELPDLIEKEQWCVLGDKEQAAYRDAVASGNLMAMRQVSWQVDSLTESSKAQRLLEICDNAKEQGRKVIVFSFFRNTLEKVHALLGTRCSKTISGDISPAERQEIVDQFNSADAGAVLVSQVQAGGTGLNIQAASVIVFCEPQLTPAIENQAIGRAYRMGQVRDVLVYRLLADETIDERMLEILSTKQKEFDSFADDSVIGEEQLAATEAAEGSWITKMVREEQARLGAAENTTKEKGITS